MTLLNRWGTVAFEPDVIESLLCFDPATHFLVLGNWLAFVPECYRDKVIEGIDKISPAYVKKKWTRITMHDFIAEMVAFITLEVDPILAGLPSDTPKVGPITIDVTLSDDSEVVGKR